STGGSDHAILGGLALVIVGSLGPWATSPLSSASGTSGDGKWTILLALIALFVLWRSGRRAWIPLAILAIVIAAIGVADAIRIHHELAKVTLFGRQIDSVGWSVYAVIVGAVVTLVALWRVWAWSSVGTAGGVAAIELSLIPRLQSQDSITSRPSSS